MDVGITNINFILCNLRLCDIRIRKRNHRILHRERVSVYRPEMPEMHLQNFEKLQSRKLLVKYSAYAECEIISLRKL